MKKSLLLFTGAMIFMYLAFAVNHYLGEYWFEVPTRILMILAMVIHTVLLSLHLIDQGRNKEGE